MIYLIGEVEFIGCEGGHDASGVDDEFKAGGLLGDLLEESGDLGVMGGVGAKGKAMGLAWPWLISAASLRNISMRRATRATA